MFVWISVDLSTPTFVLFVFEAIAKDQLKNVLTGQPYKLENAYNIASIYTNQLYLIIFIPQICNNNSNVLTIFWLMK